MRMQIFVCICILGLWVSAHMSARARKRRDCVPCDSVWWNFILMFYDARSGEEGPGTRQETLKQYQIDLVDVCVSACIKHKFR